LVGVVCVGVNADAETGLTVPAAVVPSLAVSFFILPPSSSLSAFWAV
jgi:hypothetical protein